MDEPMQPSLTGRGGSADGLSRRSREFGLSEIRMLPHHLDYTCRTVISARDSSSTESSSSGWRTAGISELSREERRPSGRAARGASCDDVTCTRDLGLYSVHRCAEPEQRAVLEAEAKIAGWTSSRGLTT